jgi:hypothetical protein
MKSCSSCVHFTKELVITQLSSSTSDFSKFSDIPLYMYIISQSTKHTEQDRFPVINKLLLELFSCVVQKEMPFLCLCDG